MAFRLYLVLQRSPDQQSALDNLIARQQQPTAQEYHKWLTPQAYGARYGASPQDIAKITTWLASQGLHVNGVMNSAMLVDFSATAGQLRNVFHTHLHYYNIQGGKYAANADDPMVPAALAPVVASIQGLSKIPPHSNHSGVSVVRSASDAKASPAFTYRNGSQWVYVVTPQDLYTIYNVNPVFNVNGGTGNGNLGANATVAVIEQSDIEYGTVDSTTGAATGGDVATFRSMFGVPGTLNMHVYHGYGSVTCADPSYTEKDELEATLDAEWANALAPSANLIFMSCDATSANGAGIWSSMAAVVDNNLADVISLSYSSSETGTNASNYAYLDALYTQAATQGQSIFISSGDSGSDAYDLRTTGTATYGINVNAFASSPLVTVAGGTDFSDLYDAQMGGPPQSNYWSATNSANYNNALSYIPETTWNDSCASSIFAEWMGYTPAGYCGLGNHYTGGFVTGGSGGFSAHYPVPAYQSGITGYTGTMRALPDISGFAADDQFWGHGLLFCNSYGAAEPCYTSDGNVYFGIGSGTSFVAPYMAGIQFAGGGLPCHARAASQLHRKQAGPAESGAVRSGSAAVHESGHRERRQFVHRRRIQQPRTQGRCL